MPVDLRADWETPDFPIILNGVVGPSGDGYQVGAALSPEAALEAHRVQVSALSDAGADMITAVTMTHSGEAIGVARAAQAEGIPVVVSFTVETDGNLPSGETLASAVAAVDGATGNAPLYYMVNCAHPTHFFDVVGPGLAERLGGIRANASRMSHAELDAAEVLDDGDPDEFGRLYGELAQRMPRLRVIGGCCGTDHRHVGRASSEVLGSMLA